MRVAIDATPLLGRRTGVGVMTAAIVEGLAARPDVEVTAFPVSLRGRSDLRGAVPERVRVAAPPLPAKVARAVWGRFDVPPIEWLVGAHDVVHGPNFVVPPARAACVATVHDLSPLKFPHLCHPDTLAFPDLVRRASASGAWVHVSTRAGRDEVVDDLGLDPERVVVVPLGVTSRSGGDASTGRAAAGVPDYVLVVGTVEPRKDLPSLLRAVDALAARHPELHLVHAGGDGWGVEGFARTLAGMAHADRVHRLGHVGDDVLRDLYAGARVVAYPSVYEGFGFPVLEAMTAGVPVVTTDVPALREVAGAAARIVPVGDDDALAAAIEDLWTDDAEQSRLAVAGLDRAAGYTWGALVDGLVDLYRRAVDAA